MVILLSVTPDCLFLEFNSDITFVDIAVEMIRNILEYLKVVDPTNLLLVSKELLKNAVVHGNQNDREKEVVFRLFPLGQDRFRLEVEDSGPGISVKNGRTTSLKLDSTQKRGEIGGHGFTIINSLSDQVSFSETGSKITVLLDS
ncbi:MAG: ATP-binding protein [Spirochaetaceae bacterium]|nr:MAG: ATP-binding protein [Spirochaetaceae bacterium]